MIFCIEFLPIRDWLQKSKIKKSYLSIWLKINDYNHWFWFFGDFNHNWLQSKMILKTAHV